MINFLTKKYSGLKKKQKQGINEMIKVVGRFLKMFRIFKLTIILLPAVHFKTPYVRSDVFRHTEEDRLRTYPDIQNRIPDIKFFRNFIRTGGSPYKPLRSTLHY